MIESILADTTLLLLAALTAGSGILLIALAVVGILEDRRRAR